MNMKTRYNSFYYIGISILILTFTTYMSSFMSLENMIGTVLLTISALCFLIKILTNTYKTSEFIVILLLGLVCLWVSIKTNSFFIFLNYLAFVAIKNTDCSKTIKIDFYVKISFLLFHTILYLLYVVLDFQLISNTIIDETRHSLFLNHPNNVGSLVIMILFDIYLLKEHYGVKDIILGYLCLGFFYYFSRSRTMLYIFTIFVLFIILKRGLGKYWNGISKWLSKYMFDMFIFITLFLIIYATYVNVYNSKILMFINDLLSNRLGYSISAFRYGFAFFPSNVVIPNDIIIDSFYVKCIVNYGFVLLCVISFIIKQAVKNATSKTKLMILMFSIGMLSELYFANVGRCIMLLVFADSCMNRQCICEGSEL